ncbi:uncharacterized protein LOC115454272 [Manduca sexta]|uniref:uncharacterized protein LOC115454272 n=1 Tax=Manduca sexta TaxID=7130 RepID=UPI001183321B|nr:uncharacterized protein LOC115454272 [Manduca sexta]
MGEQLFYFSRPKNSSLEPCVCEKCDGVRIAVYGVVLLSLTIILMFIAICCLCYIIYRMRNTRYKEISKDNVPISNDYVRQSSNENAEPTSMKIINFDSPFKSTDTLPIVAPDVKDKPKPEPKPMIKPDRPEYPKPANGVKLHMQPVITPDQMNKVCVEVLKKMKRNQSTSLTHLNELMKHNEEHPDKSEFEADCEYDVLPKQPEIGDDVYDCPPMSNNHDDDDRQDYYDNVPIREETYANVKFIHGIHSNHTAL